jgi:hypothetical protein
MGLFAEETSVAIDGSKFKAVNNRDKNFTRARPFKDEDLLVKPKKRGSQSKK